MARREDWKHIRLIRKVGLIEISKSLTERPLILIPEGDSDNAFSNKIKEHMLLEKNQCMQQQSQYNHKLELIYGIFYWLYP